MPRDKRRRSPKRLRQAHYWIGLSLALPLALLAITGIVLNHSSDLNLNTRYSNLGWLLNLYGVEPTPPTSGFKIENQWLSHARDSLWLDAQPIDSSTAQPLGVVAMDALLIVGFPDHLRLYTREGQAVETVPVPDQIQPLVNIANKQDSFLARGNGNALTTTADFLSWQPHSGAWPKNQIAETLPEALQKQIAARLSAQTLTWEKIMLDLHSGRIFGPWGPLLVDLVALVTLVLAITGCLLWVRRLRR